MTRNNFRRITFYLNLELYDDVTLDKDQLIVLWWNVLFTMFAVVRLDWLLVWVRRTQLSRMRLTSPQTDSCSSLWQVQTNPPITAQHPFHSANQRAECSCSLHERRKQRIKESAKTHLSMKFYKSTFDKLFDNNVLCIALTAGDESSVLNECWSIN